MQKTCVAGPPVFDIQAPRDYADDLRAFVTESIEDQATKLAACSTAAGNPTGAIEIQLGMHEDPEYGVSSSFATTTRNETRGDLLAQCLAAPLAAIADETGALGLHYYYTATVPITCGPAPIPPLPAPPPSGSTVCKVIGSPKFGAAAENIWVSTGTVLPSVMKEVKALVKTSADDITACGVGVGASAGSVELTFGLDYDEEVFTYYRVSENATGNRALGTCLRGVAKAIAESTYGFDAPDGDGDVGDGNYEAKVTLSCAPAK